jgi:D-threo-aldose 1-dehydrogenase
MKHDDRVKLRTGLEISRMALGTAAFGGLYASVTNQQCFETFDAAIKSGINYLDTAPHYGKGRSEMRIAQALTSIDRSSVVISTKVGRLLVPSSTDVDTFFLDADNSVERRFDFSAVGIRRSFEDSLRRLGTDHIDILFIHDPDDHADDAVLKAYPELEKMRSEGLIKAIGIGMNQCQIPSRMIRETDIDLVLIAGRYSLLDQSAANELLPLALERGVDVIAAGVFNSGVLANPVKGATYDYTPASDELIARAQRIRQVLDGHQISLTGAAMHFPLQHPAVKAVLVGCRSAGEVAKNIEEFDKAIPNKVWEDLVSVQ